MPNASRNLVVALAATALVAGRAAAESPQPPANPFGPEVRTLALRVVDAPDAFGVKPEGVSIGGTIFTTLMLGLVVGVTAGVTNSKGIARGDRAEALQLFAAHAPALERFAFTTRIAADVQRELERGGRVSVVGAPVLVALAEAAAKPGSNAAEPLALTPEELLEGSGADAVLVIRPWLTLEDRARYLRLRLRFDVYYKRADGQLGHRYAAQGGGSVSKAIDGKRTPPKTADGQILDYGGRWLTDDAARLRAGYELLLARELPRRLSKFRDFSSWYEE